jgi:hypothetical protein
MPAPNVQLIEHAEITVALIWVEARLEELHAPLANFLSMPVVVRIMHA